MAANHPWSGKLTRRPRSLCRPLRLERLEERDCPAVTVQIDYRFDTGNFFNTSQKRDLLQQAADSWAAALNDRLLAITPSGSNTFTALLDPAPSSGQQARVTNLTVPADTLILFAGARALPNDTLAEAGPDLYEADGDAAWLERVAGRGQEGALAADPAGRTDFAPWGGSVAFSTTVDWYFGTDPHGVGTGQSDFLEVALHEMGHLFGIGTADSWHNQVSGGVFIGPLATATFDFAGSPPVDPAGDHWERGLTDDGFVVLLDPDSAGPPRILISALDRAALADIGWELAGDEDASLNTAVESGFVPGIERFSTSGRLDTALDVDLVRFELSEGQTFDLSTGSVSGGETVDTFLRLFNEFGQELARDDNGCSEPGYSRIVFTAPAAGVYFVAVSSGPNNAYLVTEPFAHGVAGPQGDYVLTILDGAQTVGQLELSDEIFQAGEGSAGVVTITRTGSTAGSASVTVVVIPGFGPRGASELDVEALSVLVEFADGQATATALVLRDDSAVEGPETLQVTLQSPERATLAAQTLATVVIDDTDGSATERFVCETFVRVLEVQPDAGGLSFWTNYLTFTNPGVAGRQVFAQLLLSSEAGRRIQLNRVYQQYLGRNVDEGGRTFWTDLLNRKRVNLDQVASLMVSTPEFLQRTGETAAGFADAIVQAATGQARGAGDPAPGANLLDGTLFDVTQDGRIDAADGGFTVGQFARFQYALAVTGGDGRGGLAADQHAVRQFYERAGVALDSDVNLYVNQLQTFFTQAPLFLFADDVVFSQILAKRRD